MYKHDQGRITRIVTFILFLVAGFYSGYCWYYWWEKSLFPGAAGAAVLLVALAALGWMVCFRKEKSGETLIEIDGEMRKVTWPGVKPMFDPKTEAWGSTYVVIACTIVFTALIFALDAVLGFGIHQVFFKYLIFGADA